MVKKYGDLYQDTRRALLETEDAQDAGVLARMLVCHYSGKSQADFLADRDLYASDKIVSDVESGLQRLLEGEPMPYILGQWEFFGLPLHVNRNVLIPRDDTVLDLCCGSGCIGLAIASRVKDAKVTLADISHEALAVAKENVALNKLSGRVRCVRANALEPAFPFLGRYDMIVSNPPYITGADMKTLEKSVMNYEPHLALYGGEDGLDFYRSIVKNFAPALKPGGYLAFEFGDDQGDDVCRILEENGYTILERARDYHQRERAVLAQYGRKEA